MLTTNETQELIKKRREYAVNLKISGLSLDTILNEVNKQNEFQNWGKITRVVLEQDIAQYFRENRAASIDNIDHNERMREALIAQMEKGIERLALHIANNRDWKPFEKADSYDKMFRMQTQLAEINNWNLGRPSPIININNTSIEQVFEVAAIHNQKMPIAMKEDLLSILNELADEMKDADRNKGYETPAEAEAAQEGVQLAQKIVKKIGAEDIIENTEAFDSEKHIIDIEVSVLPEPEEVVEEEQEAQEKVPDAELREEL